MTKKEKENLLNHDYDGIQELDNDLPPWWKGLFWLTIIFSVVYVFNYHILNTSDLQEGEYIAEMESVEKIHITPVKSTSPKSTHQTDANSIANGKEVYTVNCVACHLPSGGGSIGPNLTDKYWIHGGSFSDIVKLISIGVPEKGMLSWEKVLTTDQIHNVTNYILSLQGTEPPEGKAPEGDIFE